MSKYDMALKQSLEQIQSRADWIQVSWDDDVLSALFSRFLCQRSTEDILAWLEKRKAQ